MLNIHNIYFPKPFSDKYKARKYKVQEQFLTRVDFYFIMRNLPVKVGLCFLAGQ